MDMWIYVLTGKFHQINSPLDQWIFFLKFQKLWTVPDPNSYSMLVYMVNRGVVANDSVVCHYHGNIVTLGKLLVHSLHPDKTEIDDFQSKMLKKKEFELAV